MSECLFHRYGIDNEDEIPTMSFKQLLIKCNCQKCKDILKSWYEK